MFFSQGQIENSLAELERVHPFYGISFLVFKQGNLSVEKMDEFPINHEDDRFLKKYYQPDKRSAWFFRPFRISDKSQYWLRPDYASSGLQAIRMQTFSQAFLHETGTNLWGWQIDYIKVLKEKLNRKHPLPAFALAIWLYRDEYWPQNTTLQKVLNRFFSQFKITDVEKKELFNVSIPQNLQGWLTEKPFSWAKLTDNLNIPPPIDVPHDEGGTLSALTVEGVGPARKLHLDLVERANLFTGDNGLGKSFILESAWWALSGKWAGFPAYPREDAKRNEPRISFQILGSFGRSNYGESTYDWEQQEWSTQDERPTVPGLLIYARVDGAFAVWDPARDYWANTEKVVSTKPLIFSREEVWNGIRDEVGGKTTFVSNGLITDWILWQNSPEKETFEILGSGKVVTDDQ